MHKWVTENFNYYQNRLRISFPKPTYQFVESSSEVKMDTNQLWIEKGSMNAVKICRDMFQGEMIQTDLTEEEALEYIRGYTYIRSDLRNKINHANGNIKLHKIQHELNEYLKLVRKIHDKKHIHTGLWAEDTKEATS